MSRIRIGLLALLVRTKLFVVFVQWIIAVVLGLVVVACGLACWIFGLNSFIIFVELFSDEGYRGEVKRHHWESFLAVEEGAVASGMGWCSKRPPGAKVRTREARPGPGNPGREVPEEWCTWSYETWVRKNTLELEGDDTHPRKPVFRGSDCEALGCTRAGGWSVEYSLDVRVPDHGTKRCRTDERSRWRRATKGDRIYLYRRNPLFRFDCRF